MKCRTCKNEIKTRQVIRKGVTGPFGSVLKETQEYCPYCEWKGTTGAGFALKRMIQQGA